jgi:hypothetical protein
MRQAWLGSNFPATRKKLPVSTEKAENRGSAVNHVRMLLEWLGNSCRTGQELPPRSGFGGRMCRVKESRIARRFIELEFIFC